MKKYGKMGKVIKNQTKPNQIEPVKALETLERFHVSLKQIRFNFARVLQSLNRCCEKL